ncbi:hypothetical protein K432DRAFT_272957, partial [Lepidopterella palustris CBS 459.81]
MACRRNSNFERARWREECREKLSRHISARLGIRVDPENVRLITASEDPYVWNVLPGREHLFSKHMSKHSTGAYMQLCRELGSGFEAVPAKVEALFTSVIPKLIYFENSGCMFAQPSSFKSTIEELEAKNKNLVDEIKRLQDTLDIEIRRRQCAEDKIRDL